jgi:branched-chain amino acid aminotransferase
MEDNAGKYVVHNGIVKRCSEIEIINAQTMTGRAVYEVIRVFNGIPLFFEDHYDRLMSTLKAVGGRLDLSDQQLAGDIRKLLDNTGNNNCNVKIVVLDEAQCQERFVYVSKSHYPAEAEVSNGVRTGLLQIERKNPNAKIIDKAYNDAVEEKLSEGRYFEVILVDSQGRITEGSRSNLFFIKNGRIVTAPEEFVLKGISRKYVFEACKNAGFSAEQEFVRTDAIDDIEGCFLSGTSINVLPVKSIGDTVLDSAANPVISAIRHEYDKIIEEYIDNHVKLW